MPNTNDGQPVSSEPVPNASSANPTPQEEQLSHPQSLDAPPVNAPVDAADEEAEAISAYRTLEAHKKRRRRNHIIVGCIIAALAAAGIAWFVSTQAPAASEGDLPEYEIGYVLQDTYQSSVSASGAIKPESQVVVTPEVDGIIEKIYVGEGEQVSKDDVLFTLRNAALDKAVQDAEQGLKTANNGVTSAQNALQSAQSALDKAQSTYDSVFAASYETQEEADEAGQQAVDALLSAESSVSDAELGVENAQLAVTTAQETLDQARANADKRTVKAPQGGAVVSMTAVEGASVGSAGNSTQSSGGSLVTIADLSTLRVSVQVNEVDINKLKEGQTAEVTFSALPDVVLEAVVERIASVSSSGGGEEAYSGGGVVTYDVDMLIESPDPSVKPGMTAHVKVVTEKIDNALTVPTAALQMIDEQTATIEVDPNYTGEGEPAFEERTVTVVTQDSSTAVVEGDVADGNAVKVLYGSSDEGALDETTMV